MSYPHYSSECAGHHGLVRDFGGERPRIVVLCGSTRFGNFFREANLRLTLAGEIVLSIGCDTKNDADLAAAGELGHDMEQAKIGLDALHKRKIDLADYCLVVSDESGYFGNSTLSEIEYALAHGKPVTYANRAAAMRARDHGLLMADGYQVPDPDEAADYNEARSS
jgi:hypothetical protein